ncbi:MAG TPA: methyltransferase domain-containing protein [Phycisphaerae bacterium]|nr:methyltransferase domain-containing protein [Phycisphaerae bacterium]
MTANSRAHRRHWPALGVRMARLLCRQPERTGDLVRGSYDRIAAGYDDAWTHHMRDLSLRLLELVSPPRGAIGLDLTCGTGFVTAELNTRTGGPTIGVDSSPGMLEMARTKYGERCEFVQADAMDYLRACPRRSVDVVTCAWGLGYSRPVAVIREISRVLRPDGRVGIIDNTSFSLARVIWSSMLAFAEQPAALRHTMRVRFLPAGCVLSAIMRTCGLAVRKAYDGSRTYYVPDGRSAIARLTATGAAAGFEFAADEAHRDQVFVRFAEIIERTAMTDQGVAITHRYLAAVGEKR